MEGVWKQVHLGLADVMAGARSYPVWSFLARFDTRQRYQRSAIGPFWLTISMGISIGCLGGLYSILFHVNPKDYIPSVAVGLVLWNFISQVLRESCHAFVESGALIKQVRLPMAAYVFRVLFRNLIFFLHHLVLVIGVLLWTGTSGLAGTLWSIAGFLLLVYILFWCGLFFAVLSARFRDIPMIVENFLQLAFYLTPVVWFPDMLGGRYQFVLQMNPLYYAIEIIRAPIIASIPGLTTYVASGLIGIVCTLLGAFAVARSRKSLAYWV